MFNNLVFYTTETKKEIGESTYTNSWAKTFDKKIEDIIKYKITKNWYIVGYNPIAKSNNYKIEMCISIKEAIRVYKLEKID